MGSRLFCRLTSDCPRASSWPPSSFSPFQLEQGLLSGETFFKRLNVNNLLLLPQQSSSRKKLHFKSIFFRICDNILGLCSTCLMPKSQHHQSPSPGGRSWRVPLPASLSPRALLHTAFFLLYSEHGSHQQVRFIHFSGYTFLHLTDVLQFNSPELMDLLGYSSFSLLEESPEKYEQHTICFMAEKWGFPGGPVVTTCLQCRRCGIDPWVGKIPWRRKWQPTPVFLPGKAHGHRSLEGYSPRGRKDRILLSD